MWVFSVKMLNTKCSQWCGCADPSVWVHSLQHTHYSGSGFHEHDNSFLICRLFWLYGAFCHAKVFNLYIVKCESTVLHCFWQECHKVKGSLSSQGVLEPGAKHTPHKDNHSLRPPANCPISLLLTGVQMLRPGAERRARQQSWKPGCQGGYQEWGGCAWLSHRLSHGPLWTSVSSLRWKKRAS